MTRVSRAISSDVDWQAASDQHPCPICGSSDAGCTTSLEESFVTCFRCPSDWVLTTGAWLHALPSRLDASDSANDDEHPTSVVDRLGSIGSSLVGSGA